MVIEPNGDLELGMVVLRALQPADGGPTYVEIATDPPDAPVGNILRLFDKTKAALMAPI